MPGLQEAQHHTQPAEDLPDSGCTGLPVGCGPPGVLAWPVVYEPGVLAFIAQ
jgi:hypothetical protein